jgi:outer membrane protein assembly factor BamA
VLSARWSYNTTNAPFFPTEGTLLTVTPQYTLADGVDNFSYTGGTEHSGAFHSRAWGT